MKLVLSHACDGVLFLAYAILLVFQASNIVISCTNLIANEIGQNGLLRHFHLHLGRRLTSKQIETSKCGFLLVDASAIHQMFIMLMCVSVVGFESTR